VFAPLAARVPGVRGLPVRSPQSCDTDSGAVGKREADMTLKKKLKTYQDAVDEGKFDLRSLEVYNQSSTESAGFKAREETA
jgi:hypothetical protein